MRSEADTTNEISSLREEPLGPSAADRRSRLLILTGVAALLTNAVLDAPPWLHLSRSFATVAGLADWRGFVFLWVALLLVVVVTARVWTPVICAATTAGILSAVSATKFAILGETLVAADVSFVLSPGLILDMVPWWTIPATLAVATIAVLVGVRLDRRDFLDARPRVRFATRAGAAIGLTALVVACYTFGHAKNPLRLAWEASGVTWSVWASDWNVRDNGFIGALLSTMPVEPMERPSGYSRAALDDIAERYRDVSAAEDTTRSRTPWNIVVVLSESFADPVGLEGITLDEDPLAAVRDLLDASPGQALGAIYGTGTSTMEFQALTGQSIGLFSPQVVSPYHSFVSDRDYFPSAVGMFDDQGYETLALHSFNDSMYKRPAVYEALGFDRVLFDGDMTHTDRIEENPYISDAAAFAEVLDHLEATPEPMFTHVVTMQNHVPFLDWYADPVAVASPAGDHPDLGMWSRGLSYSSDALTSFLADLDDLSEPTAVVYFGDHFAPVFDPGDKARIGAERLQRMPLLIWTNQRDARYTQRDLGTVGPQYFLPTLFDALDLPSPPLYALLNEVRREIGTVNRGSIVTTTGETISESDLDPDQRELLEDYRLVQYDLSVGRRYVADDMWSVRRPAAGD